MGRNPRRQYPILSKYRLIFDLILLTCLSIPAWRPLLATGYPATHDGIFHLFRLVELDGAIQAGVFYPRLASNLALGYDYPIFNYYSPLSTYIAVLFKLMGLGHIDAIKATTALAIIMAGWTMLLFAREVMPRAGAFLAGLAYMYVPYLLLDIYVRGALAETLAISLLPLCLWGFQRLAVDVNADTIIMTALSLVGLMLAHNVTTVAFIPVLGAYWFVTAIRHQRDHSIRVMMRGIWGIGAAIGLAVLLGAFYWVPALFERDLIVSGRITEGHFDYHKHFLSLDQLIQTSLAYDYHDKPSQGGQFQAGLAQVTLGLVGCLAAFARAGVRQREALFWGVVLVGGIAIQFPQAVLLWEAVPFVA